MKTYNLNGQWNMTRVATGDKYEVNVPSDNYTQLLELGVIPDPYYKDNEKLVEWVGREDWTYEKTFSLLTQVIGRSGRSEEGTAVIQTISPDNEIITLSSEQDYEQFYETEILQRKIKSWISRVKEYKRRREYEKSGVFVRRENRIFPMRRS